MADLQRFVPTGRLLAITPQALGAEFAIYVQPLAPFEMACDGRVAVVHVCGPLEYAPGMRDTYAGVRARVQAALASTAQAVAICVASPGGEVWGAFDTARAIRADAASARKPLIGYTDSQACSAAYGLLTAAPLVIASESASVGSVGVIAAVAEQSRAEAAAGISWAILASGDRKPDGNPHMPFSEAAIAALQRHVDESAQLFFQLVNQHRGISVDQVQALQGGILLGAAAQAAGLVDAIGSYDDMLKLACSAQLPPLGATVAVQASSDAKDPSMADSDKKDDKKDEDKPVEGSSLAALQAEAEDDSDPDKKARARKALRAYYSDEPAKAEDDKKPAEAASAVTPEFVALSMQLSAANSKLAALEKAEADRVVAAALAQRTALEATRPDLAAAFAALPNRSISDVTALIAAVPAPSGYVDVMAHAARGAHQSPAGGNGGDYAQARQLMAHAFGTEAPEPRVERRGNTTIFRAIPQAQAAGK